MKALIFNKKVVDIQEKDFPVHKSMYWVDCDNTVEVGFTYIKTAKRFDSPVVEELDYKQKRAAEYPSIGDQLDVIMKWAFSETEITLPEEFKSLAGKCMSVKSKYPKV